MEERLIKLQYEVIGYDVGYFKDCALSKVNENPRQILKDIRDIERRDIEGVDVIIHLAGLSNDPLGDFQAGLTEEINLLATIRLAELALESGVKRFIYASSQSMYGVADTDDELDEDNSNKNPITTYAITKWKAELAILKLNSDQFTVCAFRPSTVFGASTRLRCDIVFNNLVACAFTTNKIEIKSDGTPWRPVVHVQDVCSAFIAGIQAPATMLGGRAFNVGISNGNFSIKDLAIAVQKAVPGSRLSFTGEHGNDSRTYRVSFDRILNELKEYYKPEWTLDRGATELIDYFKKIKFTEDTFRGSKTNRLLKIKEHINEKTIDLNLRVNTR